jgi:hypothetical protein
VLKKSILFKKSKEIARGFFKYAYDSLKKVIQVCWFDAISLFFCSRIFTLAMPASVTRLTHTILEGYMYRNMVAPLLAVWYNAFMGACDSFDRLNLTPNAVWR